MLLRNLNGTQLLIANCELRIANCLYPTFKCCISTGFSISSGSTPQYTSKTCHRFLHIGLCSGKSFKCTNDVCLWHGDADWKGSFNIATIGASVSRL
ncbi:transposase [Pleurocapsales cyanobacterium LEGE 06147]|nr:transposase [Pleurocapsales cyanobacterium LEGE 06147]